MSARYASRRRQQGWSRNQNTTKFVSSVKLGPVMHTIILSSMLLVLGIVYLTQAAGVSSYDYTASEMDNKISELETKKYDLEVENARISSLSNLKNSDVAQNMTEPTEVNYAN